MKKIVLSVPDEALPRIEKAFTRHCLVGVGEEETPLETIKRGLLSYIKSIVAISEEEEAREKSEDLGI